MRSDIPPRRLNIDEVGPRKFDVIDPGRCYRLSAPKILVTLEVDRINWQKQELLGELMVSCDFLGTDAVNGVLSVASFNLSSARARSERATLLAKQAKADDIPWAPLLEDLCQRVLAAQRSGDPAVEMSEIDDQDEPHRVLRVFGLQLPRRHPSILFGDGGAAKSLLALYIGGLLAREGYRVLLVDWELDGSDHRRRYGQLFGTDMPRGLLYVRCSRPMIHEADRLRRIVSLQGIDYRIHDSVGFACHEAPESATAALAYFQADRHIGTGGLHIAHINRSETGDQKPFGSQFWHNSARSTFFLKATEDTDRLTVGAFCRKSNLGPKQPPFAFEVSFGERTTFTMRDITEVTELAPQATLSQRMEKFLKEGSKTREAIVIAFPDEDPAAIRQVIKRGLDKGKLVKFERPDGEYVGLASRR